MSTRVEVVPSTQSDLSLGMRAAIRATIRATVGVSGSGEPHGEDALIHSRQDRAEVSKSMSGAVAFGT